MKKKIASGALPEILDFQWEAILSAIRILLITELNVSDKYRLGKMSASLWETHFPGVFLTTQEPVSSY